MRSSMRVETIGNATLYLGDCREILPTLPKIDLIITDPPYGISHPCNFKGRGRGKLAACNDYPDVIDDNKPFDPAFLLALNVPTVLWGANYFADKLPTTSGWLVWDKERPDALDQATCELAWTNYVKGVRRFRHLWNGMMKASERGESYHPTQKPVALSDWVLSLKWTPQGTVFDPYMGSAPVGVSCVLAGRKYIGVEREPVHFETACRRISEAQSQQRLFAA